MSTGKETNGNNKVVSMEDICANENSLNKHACACVLAATIISAIFGYSKWLSIFFISLIVYRLIYYSCVLEE
jgi:hypothetical protein